MEKTPVEKKNNGREVSNLQGKLFFTDLPDNYSIIKNMLQIDMEYDNFISYQKV